jgi:hypothetical protein
MDSDPKYKEGFIVYGFGVLKNVFKVKENPWGRKMIMDEI